MLEEKLVSVRNIASSHIGRSQTDLSRVFEKIKTELGQLYEERAENFRQEENDAGNC